MGFEKEEIKSIIKENIKTIERYKQRKRIIY